MYPEPLGGGVEQQLASSGCHYRSLLLFVVYIIDRLQIKDLDPFRHQSLEWWAIEVWFAPIHHLSRSHVWNQFIRRLTNLVIQTPHTGCEQIVKCVIRRRWMVDAGDEQCAGRPTTGGVRGFPCLIHKVGIISLSSARLSPSIHM